MAILVNPMRRFSVEEYHRLIQLGILGEDDPVELLAGWIVPKMPKNPRHDALIDLIRELFERLMRPGWRVRVQSAVTLIDSEPEPDLAVVGGPATRYLQHHPRPEDIGVIVEVAESSVLRDRRDKALIYAAAGIAWYWIIDVTHRRVVVFSQPVRGVYQAEVAFEADQTVMLVIDGQEVGELRVAELLGLDAATR